MDRQILNFTANEQILTCDNPIRISTNKVNYIEARFDLGQNWSGYDSVRAVWFNDFQCISTVLDSQGVTFVPFEVMKRKGNVKVNLVGSISENDVPTDRLTSYPVVAVIVDCIAQITGAETNPITPSQFEQFVSVVISEVEKVTGMTAQAETLPAGSQATARYENGILYLGIPQGIQGERGETGADGNGIASVVYNADYTLTFVFTNGERFTTPPIRGERGPAGADGRDGTDGRDGADGVTPSLSVGTVTTLPSTEDAYVTRTGTDENPVFNFGIPQGPKGDTGEVTMSQLSALLPTDTASGDIASFSDGTDLFPALSVKAQIEPIQDLHGYDKPWAGGAGANIINADNPLTFTTTKKITFAKPIPSGTKIYTYAKSYIYETEPQSGTKEIAMRFEDANSQPIGIGYATNTGTYSITLTGDAVSVLLYSNGYNYTESSGVKVTVTDLMVSKSEITSYQPYSNICPISGHTECVTSVVGKNLIDESTNESGAIDANGNLTVNANFNRTQLISVSSTVEIRANLNSGYTVRVHGYNSSGQWVQQLQTIVTTGSLRTETIDIPSQIAYVRLSYPISVGTIALANIATYTTTLGRTVYGGTLDVVSGELTLTHGAVTFDGTNGTYSFLSSGRVNIDYADLGYKHEVNALIGLSNLYIEVGQKGTNSQFDTLVASMDGVFDFNNTLTASAIRIKDSRFTSLDTAKGILANTPLQVVYELAIPQTYQLDPQTIDLLLGQNNVWTDCGSVEVTYKADVGLYIDKKLG